MSDQVMLQTQTKVKPTFTPTANGLLQRCTATTECGECRKKREGTLQRTAIDSSPIQEVPPIVHEVLRSPGQPLEPEARAHMESHFGHDFSRVRVHTDEQAAASARELGACAYTVGRHLVFGPGQYLPRTVYGKQLLAHEATHAVQQAFRDVDPAQTLDVVPSRDAAEQEADQNAASLTDGGTSIVRAGRGPIRVARKGCLIGTSCKAPIPGANDETATGSSTLAKKEAQLRAKGQTTWEFSRYFRRFAEQVGSKLINVPTAWLIRKASPWIAFVGRCPADLDARDNPYTPEATGIRSATGSPDYCIFVSPQREQEAKTFLTDPKAKLIGKQSRAAWEFETRMVVHHEAAHIPVNREVNEEFAKGIITRQEAEMKIGPLNEAAGVLAELPLIYQHEVDLDPWRGEDKARVAVRAKIRGPNPPGSGYTIAGLLRRACCMVPCDVVKRRMKTLIAPNASKWTPKQVNIIVSEMSSLSYCDNKLDLANLRTLVPAPKTTPGHP